MDKATRFYTFRLSEMFKTAIAACSHAGCSLLIITLRDGESRLFARGCWPESSLQKQT